MRQYDYHAAVIADIREWFGEHDITTRRAVDELETIADRLWISDSVTGNASGSYWFSSFAAEEAMCHNWDLLAEALEEFGCEENPITKGVEWCDVNIRCYLLRACLEAVNDELPEAGEADAE